MIDRLQQSLSDLLLMDQAIEMVNLSALSICCSLLGRFARWLIFRMPNGFFAWKIGK
jgi:hypothetical protein